jgi:hypothetical protein
MTHVSSPIWKSTLTSSSATINPDDDGVGDSSPSALVPPAAFAIIGKADEETPILPFPFQ